MIYFDSAATSWPKPREVWEAMEHCIKFAGANPQSGHQMALKAAVWWTKPGMLASLFKIQTPTGSCLP